MRKGGRTADGMTARVTAFQVRNMARGSRLPLRSAVVMRRRSPPSSSQTTGTRSWYTCRPRQNESRMPSASFGFMSQAELQDPAQGSAHMVIA